MEFREYPRFRGIKAFDERQWLSTPTMHGEELKYMQEAYYTNWMSTVGENIDSVEERTKKFAHVPHAVALSSGTAALHLGIRLAGEILYGEHRAYEGTLRGRKVFCSDLTFDATVNPVAYEGGEAVFIDSERESWNMDPTALEKAFALYPEVKLVVMAHLYGTPARIAEIRRICDEHEALLVEDAAESFGAYAGDIMTGGFGDVGIVSFNGNKIITGTCGGALLTKSKEHAARARKWSTQAREKAPWYQHTELGYNYRMSNVVAGVVRGQIPHLNEHIEQKKAIYERYREGLKDLPVSMNPLGDPANRPNYWLSCLVIDEDAMCPVMRSDMETNYFHEEGKSCPDEIVQALNAFNAEGRPIWKPMHLQPLYREHSFVTAQGEIKSGDEKNDCSVGSDIFARGLCLPSDNKLLPANQDRIIEIIRRCFA